MTQLVFLCMNNATTSQMAAGFARSRTRNDLTVISAGVRPVDAIHPAAIEVMGEVGIDISDQPVTYISDINVSAVDILVTHCPVAQKECVIRLPGHPSQVDWNLPALSSLEGSGENISKADRAAMLEEFRKVRDMIARLVDDLFDRGYLKALMLANEKANLILNSLSEGIIAHDSNRHITYFNKAAEVITGYSRDEVIGRDCHDVFPGKFCGSKCSFCNETPSFDTIQYPFEITTKIGEKRQAEMTIHAIKDDDGRMLGVLASFRDVTLQQHLARRLGEIESFSGIIGRDKTMLEVFDLIRSVADSNVPVLIQGASGTGKELVAAAIHNEGARAKNLFVPVNCGALPEGLLESELFGHVRGAFTGAIRDKKGRFELADGGTIFLDEIGDISAAMQVKLLRVLQEGRFERVGGTHTLVSDVRIISATNKDLKKEIAEGRFREDLYYRLCVVPINLPPLHERCGDIPLLVEHICKRIASDTDREELTVSPSALDALLSYDWPGNIRELQNALQFAAVKCKGDMVELNHLPPHIIHRVMESVSEHEEMPRRFSSVAHSPAYHSTRPRRVKLTTTAVQAALHQTAGNKAKAARILGIGRATLYRFLDSHADK